MARKVKITGTPFTVDHFAQWALQLTLDTDPPRPWVVEPFQLAFIQDVFAGYRECWLIVPEGNGKTTLAAGLALYFCEFSPTPSVIPVAASARGQAEILYLQAEGLILRSKPLHDEVVSDLQRIRGRLKLSVPRYRTLPGHRRIEHYRGSRLQVVAADERTGDGVIFRLAIVDELHRHRTLGLWRTWAGKIGKQSGQVIVISTAGEPGGEFETVRAKIRQGAAGVQREGCFLRAISPGVVMHEWAVPEAGDVDDLALVKEANPFAGITIETLAAKQQDPDYSRAHWTRLTCNRPTRGDSAAIQEAEWEAARTTEVIPPAVPIWVGLDVAWKWDTTAAVPFWLRDDGFRLLGPATILTPPRNGFPLDPNEVQRALIEIHHRNPIHTIVLNLPVAGQMLADWIMSELGSRVVDRGQTAVPAAEDYERFMEGLRSGKLKHSGDRGLTAHALHAMARVDWATGKARFERPSQTRDSIEQEHRVIDALSAAARVHAQAMVVEPERVPLVVIF